MVAVQVYRRAHSTTVSMASSKFKYENKPTVENQVVTTRSLLDLLPEVLIEILAYLPAADMIAVQRTCRTIRDIVTGTAYLQYILHAKMNGVDDLLPLDFPYSERLELLRCHERSWRDPQFNLFAEPHSIRVHNLKFFTLQGGYLIYQCYPGWGKGLKYGYTDLCSADRNKEVRWVHLTMGEIQYPKSTMVAFAVDHDLVMAVRFCVRFYSSSECRPDMRVTAVSNLKSRTPIMPSLSSWHSLNSRRARLIHFQQHTMCRSHHFLDSAGLSAQKSWVITS